MRSNSPTSTTSEFAELPEDGPVRGVPLRRFTPSWGWGIGVWLVGVPLIVLGQRSDLLIALSRSWGIFPQALPPVPAMYSLDWVMMRYHLPMHLLLLAAFLLLSLRQVPMVLSALEMVPHGAGLRFQILFPRSVWVPFPSLIMLHTVLIMWLSDSGDEMGIFFFMLPIFTCLCLHFAVVQRLVQIRPGLMWLAVIATGVVCLVPPLDRLGYVLLLNPIGLMWALCALLYMPALWLGYVLSPGLMLRELTRSFPGFPRHRRT